jgi:hypothetical protein
MMVMTSRTATTSSTGKVKIAPATPVATDCQGCEVSCRSTRSRGRRATSRTRETRMLNRTRLIRLPIRSEIPPHGRQVGP